jgi:hypothetical protein
VIKLSCFFSAHRHVPFLLINLKVCSSPFALTKEQSIGAILTSFRDHSSYLPRQIKKKQTKPRPLGDNSPTANWFWGEARLWISSM